MPTAKDGAPADPWPAAGALDLDDLLAELRARASTALRSQERLRELLSAVVAVTTDLELSEVLGRIVESAIALVDARYAALGVLSADGTYLTQFITRGLTDEERRAIGPPPSGLGVLGLLIRHPHPQRIDDIGMHTDSHGFPPNHPPMRSFVGTPIRIREEVYGNLYLAEKRGAPSFTAEDEATLVALAGAAGVAIDNARLFESGRRRQQWADAVGDITHLLLEREDERGALNLLARGCCAIGGATYAAVATVDQVADGAHLLLRAVQIAGPDGPSERHGPDAVLDGPVWTELSGIRQLRVFEEGATADPTADPDDLPTAEEVREGVRAVLGPAPDGDTSPTVREGIAVLPLTVGPDGLGLLVLGVAPGASPSPTGWLGEVSDFAQQVGLALLASRAQRDRAEMALMGDRERIARDMHDHVIQRLFATGLSLQSASRLAASPMVKDRLEDAVDDLDIAIREIRAAIFELHRSSTSSVRGELEALVSSFSGGTAGAPSLTVTGALDALTPVQRADLMAVVGEGLSNIARHANADHAWVRVATSEQVTIEIEDDGVGVSPDSARSGLVNLAQRAKAAGGRFAVDRRTPSGSRLVWQVPR